MCRGMAPNGRSNAHVLEVKVINKGEEPAYLFTHVPYQLQILAVCLFFVPFCLFNLYLQDLTNLIRGVLGVF